MKTLKKLSQIPDNHPLDYPFYYIDLKYYIDSKETALVGEKHGKEILKKIEDHYRKLWQCEKLHCKIIFVIPKKIVTVNKSFIRGLLKERIYEVDLETFKSKYLFDTTESILYKIKRAIDDIFIEKDEYLFDELCNDLEDSAFLPRGTIFRKYKLK